MHGTLESLVPQLGGRGTRIAVSRRTPRSGVDSGWEFQALGGGGGGGVCAHLHHKTSYCRFGAQGLLKGLEFLS